MMVLKAVLKTVMSMYCVIQTTLHIELDGQNQSWLKGMQYLYPVVAHDRAFQRHHYFLCGSGHLLFAFHLTWFYTRNEGD